MQDAHARDPGPLSMSSLLSRLALIACALPVVAAGAADAKTKVETVREETSRDVTFGASDCSRKSRRTLTLGRRVSAVEPLEPAVGDALTDPRTGVEIARISAVRRDRRIVRWTATPLTDACPDAPYGGPWETDAVTLVAAYDRRYRVLTRGTVARRGDRMCKRVGTRLGRISRRLDRAKTIGQLARGLEAFGAAFYSLQRRFEQLRIPRDRASSFVALVATFGEIGAQAERAADAVRSFRVGVARAAIRRMKRLTRRAGRHAKRYGFQRCGAASA
jgi:hypothetical protein